MKWIRPAEGCNLWSDNMVIPVGAPNPGTAQAFANYVYDPKNQAQIAAYVNYVTPVEGTKEVLEKQDPEAGRQPADLPRRAVHGRLHTAGDPGPVVRGRGDGEVPDRGHRLTKAGAAADRSLEE